MKWIRYMYTYISSFLGLPPTPTHPCPLGHHRVPSCERPVPHCWFPLDNYFTHSNICMCQFIPHSLPWCPHVCSLHLCLYWFIFFLYYLYYFFILFVLFFYIPHLCINIQYLFFTLWVISLCMTDSRSIHISTNDPVLNVHCSTIYNSQHMEIN